MLRDLPIARRLSLLIVLGSGLVLAGVVLAAMRTSRTTLEEELEAKARAVAVATASEISGVLQAVQVNAERLAVAYEEAAPDEPGTYRLIERFLSGDERVFGAAVAVEPSLLPGRPGGWSPYVYRRHGSLAAKDLAQGGYRYEVWDWYLLPRHLRRVVWTEPYFDEGGGNILMSTVSVPLLGPGAIPAVRGVVTSDLSLSWLSSTLSSLPLGVDGYAFVISANGTYIAHVDRRFIMNESVFSVAAERGWPALRAIGRRMIHGETGFSAHRSLLTDEPAWLAYAPVPPTGWSVGVVLPDQAITARLRRLSVAQLGLGAAGLVLLTCLVVVAASTITRPLRQLEKAAASLAGGDLETELPVPRGRDEVAHLLAAFGAMRDGLKRHIADLAATTTAKERIESELQVAHSIQMSLVPKTFPPFPERAELELHAVLRPAREIGGDFYDFFLLDPDTLCLAIGDVSGKGVPAALYMAVTRTLLRTAFRSTASPAEALERVNEELARDNETSMFVTIYCAVIHVPTQRVTHASGGHPAPYLVRADGSVTEAVGPGGPLVGVFGGLSYREGTLELAAGDALVLFTDGVTEAFNPAQELLGGERTAEALRGLSDGSAQQVTEGLLTAVAAFAAGAPQSDDITVLVYRARGRGAG